MATRISYATVLGVKLPSFAILALESRVIGGHFGRVFSNKYNKLFQLSQSIFLGCYGHCHVFEEVINILRVKCPDLQQNHTSLEEMSVLVKDAVNQILLGLKGAADKKEKVLAGFVLIGMDDNRASMYTIAKGDKKWKCVAKKKKGMVAMVGSEHYQPNLEAHIKDNKFTEQMTEEEAVKRAFEAIKYETEHSFGSGGEIKVVVVSRGVNTIYKWKQDDPSYCMMEYHEQPKLSFPLDQAPHYGVINLA